MPGGFFVWGLTHLRDLSDCEFLDGALHRNWIVPNQASQPYEGNEALIAEVHQVARATVHSGGLLLLSIQCSLLHLTIFKLRHVAVNRYLTAIVRIATVTVMKEEKKKRSPHLGLKKLRTLCGKTADEFSRLTGVSYALLVAVEQGRRSLSEQDALLISATTGCDPEFNEKADGGPLKEISGQLYDEDSFRRWTEEDLPELRQLFDDSKKEDEPDVMGAILIDNLSALLEAAKVQGKDLAIAHYISWILRDASNRFGLGPALPFWIGWEVKYSDPVTTDGDVPKQTISIKRTLHKRRDSNPKTLTSFEPEDVPASKKPKSKKA